MVGSCELESAYDVVFFRQKTAYEMRISDWSSDVFSSDLLRRLCAQRLGARLRPELVGQRLAEQPQQHRCQQHECQQPRPPAQWAAPGTPWPRAWREIEAAQRPHARLAARSEEHTSELQSLMRISYAVFCLKQKNRNTITVQHIQENKPQ